MDLAKEKPYLRRMRIYFISLHFVERVRLLSQGVVKKLNAGAEVEYISVIKA